MKKMKINFINHACFKIKVNDYSILVDPWFTGKVFNNSWKLLKETNIQDIDLNDLKYIFISHEHPDHLNFETLKEIYKIKKDVKVIFPYREDSLVKNVIEKIGFSFHFIKQNTEKFFLDEKNFVKFFSNNPWGDHTIVFSIYNKIILNQNDDYTEKKIINLILNEFKSIDLFFTQFSLAGYYANSDQQNKILKLGHDYHLNKLKKYTNEFKPKLIVPFASFIYFCKKTNKFLNNFIVKPHEVINLLGNEKCQLVTYNDEVYFDNSFYQRNKKNLKIFENLFNINSKYEFYNSEIIKIDKLKDLISEKIKKTTLKNKINVLLNSENSIFRNFLNLIKLFYLILPIHIHINDLNLIVKVNLINNKVDYLDTPKKIKCHFSVPSEDLLYMFKFPWGSDTVNISSTVNHYSKKSFVFFYFLRKNYEFFGKLRK